VLAAAGFVWAVVSSTTVSCAGDDGVCENDGGRGGAAFSRPRARPQVGAPSVGRGHGDWDRAFWRLSAEAIENLAWWVQLLGQPTACQMFLTPHEVAVDTDASPWGFGGFLGAMSTGGF
jgi:hypothetical protein